MKLEQAIQSTKYRNEVHKAGLNILYTAWWLKTLASETLKKFDLTVEQYNILRILRGKHPEKMCVKDISIRMVEKNSNVPRIIDRLETKCFILRVKGKIDARQTEIFLTALGFETLEKAILAVDLSWDNNINLNNNEALEINGFLDKMKEQQK